MSRLVRIGALLGTVIVVSAGTQAKSPALEEYRCSYEARYSCAKSGCKSIIGARELASPYILVPSLQTLEQAGNREGHVEIRLCDDQGCTPIAMHASSAGAFVDLTQANRGTQYMKIFTASVGTPTIGQMTGHSRGDFTEVEDLMLLTIVGYGHCVWPSK